jgi:hypothetical protein
VEVYQVDLLGSGPSGVSAMPFGWGLPDSYSEYLEKRRLNFAKSISKIRSVFLQRAEFAP